MERALLKLFIAFVLGLVAYSDQVWALAIDETLTIRILKITDSRKTALINRGEEDDVKLNDHAKFYLSTGVVARAVCIRVSPTRSIWALYRLVNVEYLVADSVMKIKATRPLKITMDPTRQIVYDDKPKTLSDPTQIGIPLADGANDLDANSEVSAADFASEMDGGKSLSERTREAGVFTAYNTTNSETSNGSNSFSGTNAGASLGLVGQYYLHNWSTGFLKKFSLVGMALLERNSGLGFEGTTTQRSRVLFSAGAHWHAFRPATMAYSFVPYFSAMLSLGRVTDSFRAGNGSNQTDEDVGGQARGASIGGGVKYFSQRGLGATASLEYIRESEEFEQDSNNSTWIRNSSGIRLGVTLSYRM